MGLGLRAVTVRVNLGKIIASYSPQEGQQAAEFVSHDIVYAREDRVGDAQEALQEPTGHSVHLPDTH